MTQLVDIYQSKLSGETYIMDGNEYINTASLKRYSSLFFSNGELIYKGQKRVQLSHKSVRG